MPDLNCLPSLRFLIYIDKLVVNSVAYSTFLPPPALLLFLLPNAFSTSVMKMSVSLLGDLADFQQH